MYGLFFSLLQAIVYASNLNSVFVCVVHAGLVAETGLTLKFFFNPNRNTSLMNVWRIELWFKGRGKRRTSCESLYIFIYTTRGGKNSREKKAERAEKPFPFFCSSHRQVDGLHVHLSVRDGHKVRAWCIYLQKLMEISLLFVCIPTNLYTFTVLYM